MPAWFGVASCQHSMGDLILLVIRWSLHRKSLWDLSSLGWGPSKPPSSRKLSQLTFLAGSSTISSTYSQRDSTVVSLHALLVVDLGLIPDFSYDPPEPARSDLS